MLEKRGVKQESKRILFKGQRGNALILIVIAIVSIIGIAGLITDYGRGVWTKTMLQKAADLGALAGAAFLPSYTDSHESALSRVHANFSDPDSETYIPQGNYYTVELSKTIPTTFMRLFGHSSVYISVDATAVAFGEVGGLRGGAFPFCIINPNLNNDPTDDLEPFNYGRRYIIGYGEDNVIIGDWANGSDPVPSVAEGNGRGWRGALNLNDDGTLGNAGASDLCNNMIDGWPGVMVAGDEVPIQTGNITSIAGARDTMLGDNPIDWDSFDPHAHGGSSRVVFVPIIHIVNLNRNDAYTVQDFQNGAAWNHEYIVVDGFAPFFILDDQEQGDVNGDGRPRDRDWITGYFIPPVTTTNYLPPNENSENFGLYAAPRLSE